MPPPEFSEVELEDDPLSAKAQANKVKDPWYAHVQHPKSNWRFRFPHLCLTISTLPSRSDSFLPRVTLRYRRWLDAESWMNRNSKIAWVRSITPRWVNLCIAPACHLGTMVLGVRGSHCRSVGCMLLPSGN